MESHTADADALAARRKALEDSVGTVRARIASLDAEKNTVYIAVEQLNGLISQLENDEAQRRTAAEAVQAQTHSGRERQKPVVLQQYHALGGGSAGDGA